jgi:hypothetical protein
VIAAHTRADNVAGTTLLLPEVFKVGGVTAQIVSYASVVPDVMRHILRYHEIEGSIMDKKLLARPSPAAHYFTDSKTYGACATERVLARILTRPASCSPGGAQRGARQAVARSG